MPAWARGMEGPAQGSHAPSALMRDMEVHSGVPPNCSSAGGALSLCILCKYHSTRTPRMFYGKMQSCKRRGAAAGPRCLRKAELGPFPGRLSGTACRWTVCHRIACGEKLTGQRCRAHQVDLPVDQRAPRKGEALRHGGAHAPSVQVGVVRLHHLRGGGTQPMNRYRK